MWQRKISNVFLPHHSPYMFILAFLLLKQGSILFCNTIHECSRQRPLLLQEVSPIQGVCTFYGACRVKRNDYMHQVEMRDLSCSNDSVDNSSKFKVLENELIVFGCIIDSFKYIKLSGGGGG